MSNQMSEKADPNEPHAFIEKTNVPFSVARPNTAGTTAMEVPVRRVDAPPDCAVCGQPLSAPIHKAAEEQAEAEEKKWPR